MKERRRHTERRLGPVPPRTRRREIVTLLTLHRE
jgi:hypothetical protein